MKDTPDRVGVYVKPTTRNRLNKFKADLGYVSGSVIPLDKVINILLDHGREEILAEASGQAVAVNGKHVLPEAVL